MSNLRSRAAAVLLFHKNTHAHMQKSILSIMQDTCNITNSIQAGSVEHERNSLCSRVGRRYNADANTLWNQVLNSKVHILC